MIGNTDSVTLGTNGSANLTGTGETVTASGDTITLGINSAATITGSGDAITGATGDTATVVGNTDSVTLGTGGTVNLTGTGETVVAVERHSGVGQQQQRDDHRGERHHLSRTGIPLRSPAPTS